MWKRPWNHLHLFCGNYEVPTEDQMWIFKVTCSSIGCTYIFSPLPSLIKKYQGSTTRERYLIASGTNDKVPEINVWEKQVGFNIYIPNHTDFQRGEDMLSGDEVAGATYLSS